MTEYFIGAEMELQPVGGVYVSRSGMHVIGVIVSVSDGAKFMPWNFQKYSRLMETDGKLLGIIYEA